MGTIINLYVIPRQQNPNNLRAAQVAEAVVSERLVAPPVIIGPALEHRHHDWVLQPQRPNDPSCFGDRGAHIPAAPADFVRPSRRYLELPRTFADFGRTDEPQIAAVTRLDETNPAIRSDFSNYTGVRWSLRIYVAPPAFLLLVLDDGLL